MRLSRYLAKRNIPVARFAAECGVIPQSVYRWANGERLPRPDMMRRIEAATGGKVRPLDFYEQAGDP